MVEKIKEILEQREGTHGLYSEVSRVSQGIKMTMQISVNWKHLKAEQRESLEMIANKIGRVLSGNCDFLDHWHDISGYASLIVKELETQAEDESDVPAKLHRTGLNA
jgi:hypothetical protein